MNYMMTCHVLNLSGPTSTYPSNWSLITKVELSNWDKLYPAVWHVGTGLLRLFCVKVIAYSILCGKFQQYSNFWKKHGIELIPKYTNHFTIKKFEGRVITKRILTILWNQLDIVRKMLKSKFVDPQHWSCEALCLAVWIIWHIFLEIWFYWLYFGRCS